MISTLREYFDELDSAVVGFSGGVDSALVAVVGAEVIGGRCVAAIGISPSLAQLQLRQARDLAARFGLNLVEVDTSELDDPSYASNPTNRCYFCKSELWRRLGGFAAERHIQTILDGTNLDDLVEHRPGARAAGERAVSSPLAELGFTKAMVRDAARELGIPIWDAPSAPCLASRIKYGVAVTPERLKQVEEGEDLLRSIGITGDFRVRHRGDEVRLEVRPEQFDLIRSGAGVIGETFASLGFGRVTMDLGGYRRGSLLEAEEPVVELIAGTGSGSGS